MCIDPFWQEHGSWSPRVNHDDAWSIQVSSNLCIMCHAGRSCLEPFLRVPLYDIARSKTLMLDVVNGGSNQCTMLLFLIAWTIMPSIVFIPKKQRCPHEFYYGNIQLYLYLCRNGQNHHWKDSSKYSIPVFPWLSMDATAFLEPSAIWAGPHAIIARFSSPCSFLLADNTTDGASIRL